MLRPLATPPSNMFAGLMPLREAESMYTRSMERIATGRMINRGSDNPAGLIAGQHLTGAIRALEAESRALQREADFLATKDGALAAASDMSAELKSIAVQAADGLLSDAERDALEIEAASIVRAIEHTTGSTKFGSREVFEEELTSEVGSVEADDGEGGTTTYTLADVGRSLSLADDAALIDQIADQAVSDLAAMRGEIGAEIANEIEPRSRAIDVEMVSLAKAHSQIVDTDYALEAARLVRSELLTKASYHVIALDARNSGLAIDLLGAA